MAGAHHESARMTCEAATRFSPTEQTARLARRTVQAGLEERAARAASRAGACIGPSMRANVYPCEDSCVWMMSRKEVHWLKMTVLTPGLRCAAARMPSRAVVLELPSPLLLVMLMVESGARLSPRGTAGGMSAVDGSRGSARQRGQRGCSASTRSIQLLPKTCAHGVITASCNGSRQMGQSSRESMVSCSIVWSAARFSGVRSRTFWESRAERREVTRSPQSFQWLHTCRSRRRISRRLRYFSWDRPGAVVPLCWTLSRRPCASALYLRIQYDFLQAHCYDDGADLL